MDLAPLTHNLTLIRHFAWFNKQSHSQPYGSALTITFDISCAARCYCMTVIYERTMKLNYDVALSPNDWAMISSDLHDSGLHLVSKYRWQKRVNDSAYGFRETSNETTLYTIVIEGQAALTTQYTTDAQKLVKQLEENTNFKVETTKETTVTTEEKWVNPEGEYFLLDYDTLIGTQKIGVTPELLYDEDVRMIVTLMNKNNSEVVLTFVVIWETDGVRTKGIIEEMCVNLPLPDIGSMQHFVESTIGNYSIITDPLIECYFDAKTESRSECTPDIIAKTREARLAAREEEE